MLERRALQVAGLLILAASSLRGSEAPFSFLTPHSGQMLLGATEFRFTVAPDWGLERIDVYVGGLLAGSANPPEWSLAWTAPELLISVQIVAVGFRDGLVVHRDAITTSHTQLGFSEEIEVEEVPIYPVVLDRGGDYVRGLAAEDFHVLDHGVPAELAFFSARPADLTVALLIDVSTSMTDKLQMVQDAACGFIDLLAATDRIEVYAFDHGLIEVTQGPALAAQAKAAVRSLGAWGGTALYDAILNTLARFSVREGRKALIVFSDGRDERSLASSTQAVEAARGNDVILYAIGAGESAEDVQARDGLEELARGAGGQAFFATRYGRLTDHFDAILEDLRAQYFLSIRPRAGPPGRRHLRVTVADPQLQVRAREYYDYDTGIRD